MAADLDAVSEPARLAAEYEGISVEELQLAARSHRLPLEALRCQPLTQPWNRGGFADNLVQVVPLVVVD
jgi:hypothetical protein